jgi:uncharacterized protein YegP (UPF0339 family)
MRTVQCLVVAAILVTSGLAFGPAATAKGGDVIRRGSCSAASHWKLKLRPDNGKIELEFEVDQNKVGRTWRVRIRENGALIFSGRRVTKAPSGSFTVRLLAANHPGRDAFRARAASVASGETCLGRASIG